MERPGIFPGLFITFISEPQAKPNLKKLIFNFILNSWFIAILIGTVVFLLIPFHTDPFKADVVIGDQSIGKGTYVQFHDLNNDGLDEKIESIYTEEEKMYSHLVLKPDGRTFEQYNIPQVGKLFIKKCFIGDYNQDGFAELFSVYNRGNEIFINVFSPFCEDSIFHGKEIKIYDIPTPIGEVADVEAPDMVLIDLFGDQNLELVVILYGRYSSIDPRRIVAIEIEEKKVIYSPQFGNAIGHLLVFDHNLDGIPELTGTMGAPNNNQDGQSWQYPDNNAWLMVFDNDLKLINDPPVFPGPFTNLWIQPVQRGGKMELVGLMLHNGKGDYPAYLFETRNIQDIIIKDTLEFMMPFVCNNIELVSDNDNVYFLLVSKNGDLVFYDEDLSIQSKVKLSRQIRFFDIIDLDQDGQDEIILIDDITKEKIFLNHKGEFLTAVYFEHEGDTPSSMGTTTGLDGQRVYYQNGQILYHFTLQRNYLHYLKWLVYPGLISFFLGLSHVFKWIQRKQIKDQEDLRKQINTLQLQSVKNQLDPHFTFNALNVLSYLSSQKDHTGVESFTHHFSKLMRRQLEMSDQPSVKLYDELRFVRHYIELQKLRFDVPILFDEEIDAEVDMNLQIPKMMIHTHVENAIKHGLIPTKGGAVRIWIQKANKKTIIKIIDNGAGRTISSIDSSNMTSGISSGKGLKVLNQLYDLYFQLYKVKIHQKIIDLKDKDGKKSGTEIRITL